MVLSSKTSAPVTTLDPVLLVTVTCRWSFRKQAAWCALGGAAAIPSDRSHRTVFPALSATLHTRSILHAGYCGNACGGSQAKGVLGAAAFLLLPVHALR
jgi:hypothetical protein